MTPRLRSLLAALASAGIVAGRVSGRPWRAVRPHVVTTVAFGLISLAGFAVWMPAGLVISAICLLVLERKVELDRR